jgi:rhodanese-related sulfurtransferase
MVNKIPLIFILTILFSCNLSDKIINEITTADFKSLNSVDDIQLIDVRTIEEYNSGYIGGALNIDFYKSSFIDSINVLDKSKTTVVYCKSGNRSSKSALMMKSLGFKNVYNLKEGMNGWLSNRNEIILDSLN